MPDLTTEAIQEDRQLQAKVSDGEAASASLGALRYEWCVVRGVTQRAYAEAVGVGQPAISESIALHRTRNQLIGCPINSPPRVQGGRPYATVPRERTQGTSPSIPDNNEIIGMTRLMAANFAAVAERIMEHERPDAATASALITTAQEAIASFRALIRHLGG